MKAKHFYRCEFIADSVYVWFFVWAVSLDSAKKKGVSGLHKRGYKHVTDFNTHEVSMEGRSFA